MDESNQEENNRRFSLDSILSMNPYRDDPLPTKEDKSTIGSPESYSSEEEDDDEAEEGIVEDTEDLPDDECICEHCPTREQLGRRLICCMSLDRWQAKFVSEDAGCLLELENFKNVFNKDCHDMVRRMMSDTIKDDNPEWPLNRFGHHSNGFQLNYHKYYRRMRYAGYRATIYFLYGKLGKRKRIQVPSCVEQRLRELYPNQPGVPYVGFHEI